MTTEIPAGPEQDISNHFDGMLPTPEGLGIIKSLDSLANVLGKEFNETQPDGTVLRKVLKFAAGLPHHARPAQVGGELNKYADMEHADYARYGWRPGDRFEDRDGITEADVLIDAARFHAQITGIPVPETEEGKKSAVKRFVLTEGSTPALNHLIRMMPLQKAKMLEKQPDGTFKYPPLGAGCVLETFELSYPLYEIPAQQMNMYREDDPAGRATPDNGRITASIKLDTDISVEDGQAIKSNAWKLNKASLTASFEANRDKTATFVFSNPSNPSGFSLSKDEMDFMAGELLKDFEYRRTHNVPAKLVIEDIAYITMMDKTHPPYLLTHAFDAMIKAEQEKAQPDEARILLMKQCKETVITEHSVSKALGVAGDRVAYTEGNPALVNALRESYTQDMLSYSNAGLYAAKGAFQAGIDPNEQDAIAGTMQTYFNRVKALETGMNNAYFQMLGTEKLALTKEQLDGTMPFPNNSSGSFFTVMNLKPLIGQEVTPELIAEIRKYIGRIDNEGIRNSFDNPAPLFKDGKINDEKDLSLYFMFKTHELSATHTAVCPVPLQDGRVRFAVGITDENEIARAVEAAGDFFQKDEAYKRGVASFHAEEPATTIDPKYTVDVSHLAEKGAIAVLAMGA